MALLIQHGAPECSTTGLVGPAAERFEPIRRAILVRNRVRGAAVFCRLRYPPEVYRGMARGEVRIAVTLACEECKRRNYQSNKNRRNDPERIELRKYCRWCGRHTAHKETR